MRYFFLFLTAFTTTAFGQKLKDRYVDLNYVQAPLTPMALPSNYHFLVTEKSPSKSGVVTIQVRPHTNAYDTRSTFYAGVSGLGQINGFTDVVFDPAVSMFYIELNVGLLDDGLRNVKSVNSDGTLYYQYLIPFKLPIEFVAFKEGVEFYRKNTNDTLFDYTFPRAYKPTEALLGYTTEAALGAAYETHRSALFLDARDKILTRWLYDTKMEFTSLFGKQITDRDVDLNFIKDKEGLFNDVNALVDHMDTLIAQLNRNHEGGQRTNWHSTYYQQQFKSLSASWEKIITDDHTANEQGRTKRFGEETTYGLTKNWFWCLFFAGEFDTVIEQCTLLEQARKKDSKAFGGIKFDNLLRFAQDYQKRYLANLDLFQGN